MPTPAVLETDVENDFAEEDTLAEEAQRFLTDLTVCLPGVSEPFAVALGKGLGIHTVGDLLKHYPRRYEDRTHFKPICDIKHGESVTISGKVIGVENIPTRTRVTLTKIAIDDRTGIAFLVFFNQWFLKKQFDKLRGKTVVAYGKASRSGRGGLDLTDVEWEAPEEDKDVLSSGRIVPVYALSAGILQGRLRRAVYTALERYGDLIEETLPVRLQERRGLPPLGESYGQIHFPDTEDARLLAQRRFVFDEFFGLQLLLAVRKRQSDKAVGTAFAEIDGPVAELKSVLPYPLTGAQARVIGEVAKDMASARAMNRLVQGDVGAGKTVIAMAALLIAVRSGYQAALMAPTENLGRAALFGHSAHDGIAGRHRRAAVGQPARQRKTRCAGLGRIGRGADCGWNPCADPDRCLISQFGSRRCGRAAPLRRHAAGGAQKQRRGPGHFSDDGDSHPAHPDADGIRRPGSQHH